MAPSVATIATFARVTVAKRERAGWRADRYGATMLDAWLRNLLKEKRVSQAELARRLTATLGRSIDRAAVNKMTTGDRKIAADEMLAITRILVKGESDSADEVQGVARIPLEVVPSAQSLVPVRVAGRVEAGAFRSQEDLGDWQEAETVLDLRDAKYPNARQLCFDVDGDSMNQLQPRPIMHGDRVFGVAFEDIEDRTPLRDGMIVVVERSRFAGQEREWSIKQVELYADRTEFHPRSSNPRHKPIVIGRDPTADDGTQVRIICLVRRVSNELP